MKKITFYYNPLVLVGFFSILASILSSLGTPGLLPSLQTIFMASVGVTTDHFHGLACRCTPSLHLLLSCSESSHGLGSRLLDSCLLAASGWWLSLWYCWAALPSPSLADPPRVGIHEAGIELGPHPKRVLHCSQSALELAMGSQFWPLCWLWSRSSRSWFCTPSDCCTDSPQSSPLCGCAHALPICSSPRTGSVAQE